MSLCHNLTGLKKNWLEGDRFLIRRFQDLDIPNVVKMIKELAVFENMPDGPKLSVNDLIRDGGLLEGNTDPPLYYGFIAEYAHDIPIPIGYSMCFYSYSTWEGKTLFIEDIYIKPEYRGKGYGRKLFTHVVRFAKKNQCRRVDFHVLKDNPAVSFYKHCGATDITEDEGWLFFRMYNQDIDKHLSDALMHETP